MAKTTSTSKQSTKKQPSDCHCNETKGSANTKSKSSKSAKDCTDCK